MKPVKPETVAVTYNYYFFDCSNTEQEEDYLKLVATIPFAVWTHNTRINGNSKLPAKETKQIEIETKFLFENQYNTGCGYRIFDWFEYDYPNADIKEGYYLSDRAELDLIKSQTKVCGYCGKQYYKSRKTFCTACAGSDYLKPDNYHLLLLRPLVGKGENATLKPEQLAKITTICEKAQAIRLKKKAKKVLADTKKKLRAAIAAAKKDCTAKVWLLNHNFDIDNVIFYNHRDVFTFGWRKPLEKEETDKLLALISEFPYSYEIISHRGNFEGLR